MKILSDLNFISIEKCSQRQVHSQDFEKLTVACNELKKLSQSGVKIAQRIEKHQQREDSRVKIPDVEFYCLVLLGGRLTRLVFA